MKLIRHATVLAVLLGPATHLAQSGPPQPLGTGFTYQGRIKQSDILVNGACDFQFKLYDEACQQEPCRGNLVAQTTINDVAVENGLFTVALDFGLGAFEGNALWLEVWAGCPSGPAKVLPRQPLTAAPYAIHALTGGEWTFVDGNPPAVTFNGEVGIGTDNPLADLEVWAHENWLRTSIEAYQPFQYGGSCGLNFHAITGLGFLTYGGILLAGVDGGENYADLHFSASQPLTKTAAGPPAGSQMVIRGETGHVGIGTMAPLFPLHVFATSTLANFEGDGSSRVRFTAATAADVVQLKLFQGSSQSWQIAAEADGAMTMRATDAATLRMVLKSSGQVGIGVSEPGEKLEVNGNVCALNVTCPSDARLKTDIASIPDALDKVSRLRGVHYRWRADGYTDYAFDTGLQTGLIAQEVKEVLPEIVREGRNGLYSIDYGRVVPVLVEAVKELDGIARQNESRLAEQSRLILQQDELIQDLARRLAALETAR
jgi:hypothetical protein